MLLPLLLCSMLSLSMAGKKIDTMEKLINNIAFDKFVVSEFDYDLFMQRVDQNAEKMVPFQDSSNDTYFKVGIIDRRTLNTSSNSLAKEFGGLKKKPWIPLKKIKEELSNCLHMKYGSVSENDFMYDKGMYGWMNIMKFSCAEAGENFFTFGMAFARTRFRLKQIFLKRQERNHWATSGRSIITRDVQKIVEVYSKKFADAAQKNFDAELQRYAEKQGGGALTGNPYVRISEKFRRVLLEIYQKNFTHTPITRSKVHQFNSLSSNVKTRVMLVKPSEVSNIVENFSGELSDEACEVLDDCRKEICNKNDTLEYDYNGKVSSHNFKKDRAAIFRLTPVESLIVFTASKPKFTFEVVKRRTSKGIVDHEQHYDEAAKQVFTELMDQQFTHEFHMHHATLVE